MLVKFSLYKVRIVSKNRKSTINVVQVKLGLFQKFF